MAGREKQCRWYFADQPNSQEVGPNNAMEQNFKGQPYASLVRESIQNSLDAVDDTTKPVRMEFSFGYLMSLVYPQLFELEKHIEGCLDYYPNNKNALEIYKPMLKSFKLYGQRGRLGYIRVSDYNTKGMSYTEGETDNPFYAFVRSAGVCAKENGTAGGSFGFGKAAYFMMSPISTILVSTCTTNYDKYFEGVTSLCTHYYKGVKKSAFGFYDDQDGKPISVETDIPVEFRRVEPGTDINILGFNYQYKDEALAEMKQAVLRNFWMAIYNGKLEVTIDENIIINRKNLAGMMEEAFPETEDNTRKANYYNPRPYFDAVRLSGTSKKYFCIEEYLPLLRGVKLYLYKCKGATDKIAYFRSSQMLIYTKRTKTNFGIYGVFYCFSEEGNEILRNLENPAHTEWKSTNWTSAGRIHPNARPALKAMEDFIGKALNDAFKIQDKSTIEIKGLEDFLYVPVSNEDFDDSESESEEVQMGNPSGRMTEEGTFFTTDVVSEDDSLYVDSIESSSASGHVVINSMNQARSSLTGTLRTGRGDAESKPDTKGIKKPGDATQRHEESQEGEEGLFATPISVPYRSFSQTEDGKVYHYVILHPQKDFGNVRLHFFAVCEDKDEELQIAESDKGTISGNEVCNLRLDYSYLRLRLRFTDNMKHAIKLSAEEIK